MKKIFIILFLAVITFQLFAGNSNWKVVQIREVPAGTPIYYTTTESGNIKYTITVDGLGITVSKSNAIKFTNGEIGLEVVKWYNIETHKIKYTTRQVQRDIDLSTVF